MKVLMYGWEFPPRISGGLGTACYAIVKELAKRNVDLTLVLPHTVAIPNIDNVNLIGCDNLLPADEPDFAGVVNLKYPGLATFLSPYISSYVFPFI